MIPGLFLVATSEKNINLFTELELRWRLSWEQLYPKNKNNERASLSTAEDATRPVRDDSLGSCPRL